MKNETRKILLGVVREISKLRSDLDSTMQRMESLESRIREIENMVRLLEEDL